MAINKSLLAPPIRKELFSKNYCDKYFQVLNVREMTIKIQVLFGETSLLNT